MTAPEWTALTATTEQALAIALGCTTRSALHSAALADSLVGDAAAFFHGLATSERRRAAMLEERLHAHLSARMTARPRAIAVADMLVSIRKAARTYERLAKSTSSARARILLFGMFDVCTLHAAAIDRDASGLVDRPTGMPPSLYADDVAAPLVVGGEEDMGFQLATQTASATQRRAALVHDMLARAYPGNGARLLFDIAEAERQHARTIASVLARLYASEPVHDGGGSDVALGGRAARAFDVGRRPRHFDWTRAAEPASGHATPRNHVIHILWPRSCMAAWSP